MKKAIINFSSRNGWYVRGQQRLKDSLMNNRFDGDIYLINDETVIGSPLHSEIPYAFKPFALDFLRQKGYDVVLWLDSSVYAIRELTSLWEWIYNYNTFMEVSGHWLSQWCNDRALKNMGITREQASIIPMYSAGLTGLNLVNSDANKFLDEWLYYAKDGETFCGDWEDHRHDMSVASYLAYKYKFKLSDGGNFMAYIGEGYSKPKESVVFYLQPPIG